jgi:hypothetical protein
MLFFALSGMIVWVNLLGLLFAWLLISRDPVEMKEHKSTSPEIYKQLMQKQD